MSLNRKEFQLALSERPLDSLCMGRRISAWERYNLILPRMFYKDMDHSYHFT